MDTLFMQRSLPNMNLYKGGMVFVMLDIRGVPCSNRRIVNARAATVMFVAMNACVANAVQVQSSGGDMLFTFGIAPTTMAAGDTALFSLDWDTA